MGTTLTWFEECGQAKVDSHKGSIIILIEEKEILRLKVSMHDSMRMACLNNTDDGSDEISRFLLTIMTMFNNPVKKLSPGTKLHDQINMGSIFIRSFNGNNVGQSGEMMQDMDLSSDIFNVFSNHKSDLGDGFAGIFFVCGFLNTEISDSKLTLL